MLFQAALLQTKSLKESEPSPAKSVQKDAKWVRKVIAHEQTKPLEVRASPDFSFLNPL